MPYSHLLSIFIRLLIYILVILYSSFEESPEMLLSLAIVANLSIIFKTYRSLPILLMFLFFLTYVVNLIPFFFAGEYIFAYNPSQGFYETLQIHTIFLCVLDIFLRPIKKRLYINEKLPQTQNLFLYLSLCTLFVFFLIFGIRGDTVLDTGGYGQKGDTSGLGGFGEYFLILIPLLYLYSGKSYIMKKIVHILMLLMGIKLLLYGGRIGVLMMGLLYLIFYYDTRKNHISLFKISCYAIPVLYIFVLIGAIRGNIALALTSSWGELLLLPFRGDFLKTFKEFFGNQNDIFYSSTVLNQAALSDTLSIYTRLEMFFYNVLSLFVPYSWLPEKATVVSYIQKNIAATGGGALISAYSYFFLSYPGVILIGYYIASIINKLQKSKNIYFILYCVIVLATYPRWFGYNVIGLFKISFYIVILYAILKRFSKIKITLFNANTHR